MSLVISDFSRMCILNYVLIISYTACPPFTFKNTLSNTDMCQPCPLFGKTTDSDAAVAVCPCDPGYYRTENEDDLPCTSK